MADLKTTSKKFSLQKGPNTLERSLITKRKEREFRSTKTMTSTSVLGEMIIIRGQGFIILQMEISILES